MNTEIHSQFDRVEAALNTLIDSITSYNPSPSAAVALVAADDELTKGLEKLSQHQANYNTILSLRATSDALDAQIKSNLHRLADVWEELDESTPITALPAKDDLKPIRPLEYAELLNYAQRIARFTVPPTRQRLQASAPKDGGFNDQAGAIAIPGIKLEVSSPGARIEQQTQQQTNTPIQTPAPAPATPVAQPATSSHLQPTGDSRAVDSLPEEVRRWLDPTSSNARVTPWPGEDVIRRGALARIQGMVESGLDPATADVNGAGDNLSLGQQVDAEEDGLAKDVGGAHEMHVQRRTALTGGPAGRERQESRDEGILGFDLYNPDDD